MFAILAAITVMFGLSLARVPVVFALIIGAVTGGLLLPSGKPNTTLKQATPMQPRTLSTG